MVIHGDKSYETHTEFLDWNIVQDGQFSNYVGLIKAVVCLFEIEHCEKK
jgi:hypothetical protein